MRSQNWPGEADGRPPLSLIDTFSGIGTFRLGYEQAATDLGLATRCVGFSEIDKAAIGVYLRHFPDTLDLGDVRTLAASASLPSFDVLLGGFLCQPFAACGLRKSFADDRGRLFFSLARIIGLRRPRAFLLENVAGLKHRHGGKVLDAILHVLRDELGYSVHVAILNSKDFGVAQSRPRLFFVGFRDGDRGFEFPLPTDSSKRLKDVLEANPVDPTYYIPEGALSSMRSHKARHKAMGHGFGYRIADPDCDIACALMLGGLGHERNLIIDRRISEFPLLPGKDSPISRECVRKLTPREWERLQGLPDEFTAKQADGARYDQLGNAVSVPVIRAIARRMLETLAQESPHVTPAIAPRKTPSRNFGPPVAVELCAGCGGLTTGLAKAGIDVAVACEIDHNAAESCRLNHPGTVVVEKDITTEDAKEAVIAALDGRECDLLVAALTCQAYSLSGIRDPADPKGSLFEHFVALVRRLHPKVAIVENVPGILSMRRPDGTLVMHAIAQSLRPLGYSVGYREVNSADFGDPQSRKRVLVLAWSEGRPPRIVSTHDEHGNHGRPPWRTVKDAIHDLADVPEDADAWHIFCRSSPHFIERIHRAPIGQGVAVGYSESFFRAPPDKPAPTIKATNGGVLVHYAKDRLMTPRELARLQSFPDNYRFHGSKGDVLRQIGNAVPIGLATAIGKAVVLAIRPDTAKGPFDAAKRQPPSNLCP
jgi:DNA (cytosine-5)-methyltransferase 1